MKKINQQLQGRGKTVCEMISALKAFTAKLSFYIQQTQNKRRSALHLSCKDARVPFRGRKGV